MIARILPMTRPRQRHPATGERRIIQVGIDQPLGNPVLHLLHGGDGGLAVKHAAAVLVILAINQVSAGGLQHRRKAIGIPFSAIVKFQVQHRLVLILLRQADQNVVELANSPGIGRTSRNPGLNQLQQALARIQPQTGIEHTYGV